MVSRRSALARLAAVAGAAGLTGCSRLLSPEVEPGVEGLPDNPLADELPDRQFAQHGYVDTDEAGNDLPPRHRLVLLLNLREEPSVEAAQTVERAMRTLEGTFDWSSDGLFHALGWGTRYFERIGALNDVPISKPKVLSRTDDPDLLSFDAILELGSDVPSRIVAAENAMFGGREELNGEPVEDRLGDVFTAAARRTGFIGRGLPAAHTDAEGVPDAIEEEHPMFMGFLSGRRRTQAGEDRVAIGEGPFADGTTMHVSHLTQDLEGWWNGLDDPERIARMFSPMFSRDEVDGFTDAVPFDSGSEGIADMVRQHGADHGVVGHHEKVAQVREDGEPIVLRRDFNTVDGESPGVHFVSVQRDLEDFRETRKAMNGWYVRQRSDDITDRRNNGILNFVRVRSRANFLVPPRDLRSFPMR